MSRLERALRWLILLGAILTVMSHSPRARADDEATLEMARDRFKEGVAYFDKKQYDKARAAFLQAYALKPHPAVLLNLAQSELRSSHEADAAAHFKMFLRDHKGATDDERKAANDGLNAAKSQLYELSVNVDVAGAEISVDNQAAGTSPLSEPLLIAVGEHTLTATKGEKQATARISAVAGGSSSTSLNLTQGTTRATAVPAPTPTPAPEGEPAAAPQPEPEPEQGSALQDPGLEQPGKPFYKKPLFWVGTGLTVAAVTAGVILAVSSSNSYDAATSIENQIAAHAASQNPPYATNGLCSPASANDSADIADRKAVYRSACNRWANNNKLGDDYKTYSTVSFVVGGIVAVGTIVYVVVDGTGPSSSADSGPHPGSRRQTRLLPILGPDTAGAMLSGSF